MPRHSPFPGMDPWLESRWAGVHHGLITAILAQLNDRLPDDLVARVGERVYIGYVDGESRHELPDVYVVGHPPATGRTAEAGGSPAGGTADGGGVRLLDPPMIVRAVDDTPSEGSIEVVDARDQTRVVTSVEVVSPTNKLDGRARQDYAAERRSLQGGGVSTVEVDLLRDGDPIVDVPYQLLPPSARTPYRACVRRAPRLGSFEAEYYPIKLRDRLRRIAVPLRETDADAPLDPDDAAWARERVDAWRRAAMPVGRPQPNDPPTGGR